MCTTVEACPLQAKILLTAYKIEIPPLEMEIVSFPQQNWGDYKFKAATEN